MTKLIFLDTETTSLRPDRRAWEIGIIARGPNGTETERHWFVRSEDLDLGNADPMSLKIGRFYDRHPQYTKGAVDHAGTSYAVAEREADVLHWVEAHTRGAHIVGAVPNFDTEVLADRMRANGICPSWHHHLIDVEPLMVGWLAAKGEPVPVPWKSDDLSRAIGVEAPAGDERHTALGDARWVARIWDEVMKAGTK